MRIALSILFVILFALVTFFGLGPVLLADGSSRERVLTLAAAIVCYALLTAGWRLAFRRFRRK